MIPDRVDGRLMRAFLSGAKIGTFRRYIFTMLDVINEFLKLVHQLHYRDLAIGRFLSGIHMLLVRVHPVLLLLHVSMHQLWVPASAIVRVSE